MRSPSVHPLTTLAVDFDGVVHSYEDGWQGGVIYGPPTEGCEAALRKLSLSYKLVIFTARHDLEAVHLWLVKEHLRQYFAEITNRKPAAVAYLDDRALKFIDWAGALKELT